MPDDSLIEEMRAALASDRASVGRRARRSSVVPPQPQLLTAGVKRGFFRRLLRRR